MICVHFVCISNAHLSLSSSLSLLPCSPLNIPKFYSIHHENMRQLRPPIHGTARLLRKRPLPPRRNRIRALLPAKRRPLLRVLRRGHPRYGNSARSSSVVASVRMPVGVNEVRSAKCPDSFSAASNLSILGCDVLNRRESSATSR